MKLGTINLELNVTNLSLLRQIELVRERIDAELDDKKLSFDNIEKLVHCSVTKVGKKKTLHLQYNYENGVAETK